MAARLVNCPTCGRPVEWRPENRWRPFCSERCRLIDLGEWASERYRLPSEQSHDGTGEGDQPGGPPRPS